jgi:PAS domain S-box-containing protein
LPRKRLFDARDRTERSNRVSRDSGIIALVGAAALAALVAAVTNGATWRGTVGDYVYFGTPALLLLLVGNQIIRRTKEAERAAAEASRRADDLVRSEARARALFVNSPDVRTITQEMPDGSFVFLDVNDAVTNTFRLPREAFVGKTPYDLYPAAAADEVYARMRECLRLGETITYEARRVAAGEVRYFETLLMPVRDPAGEAAGARLIVSNARDVTERKRLDEHLREVQRLATLSQLAGGLAHDFSNILTVVAGQQERLQTWLERNAPDEQPRRYLQNASQGLDRGAALVRRMMSFARRQEARPQALDLVALLANLVDFVRATVGAQVDVTADLPSGPLPVHADATQIELAVVNLALNARDAMPSGASPSRRAITLALWMATVTAAEPDLEPGNYAVLEVRDTGMGMDEATLARAAEPFFTTKDPGKGTGLGLAMVRGLAVQTGGALRIASARGAGTTVGLWFPLAGAPARAEDEPSLPGPATRREPERAAGED